MMSLRQPSTSSSGNSVFCRKATTMACSVGVSTVPFGALGPTGRRGPLAPLLHRLWVHAVAGGKSPGALEMRYLWRTVDHEGEVLESFVTTTRDKAAALKFIKKAMKRHGRTGAIVTDGLRSYGAALKEIGGCHLQVTGRWKNNKIENSHLPFRRRERAMERFRRMKTLQKFSSVHASVHNHFNQERHLISRDLYRERRSAALAE